MRKFEDNKTDFDDVTYLLQQVHFIRIVFEKDHGELMQADGTVIGCVVKPVISNLLEDSRFDGECLKLPKSGMGVYIFAKSTDITNYKITEEEELKLEESVNAMMENREVRTLQ